MLWTDAVILEAMTGGIKVSHQLHLPLVGGEYFWTLPRRAFWTGQRIVVVAADGELSERAAVVAIMRGYRIDSLIQLPEIYASHEYFDRVKERDIAELLAAASKGRSQVRIFNMSEYQKSELA